MATYDLLCGRSQASYDASYAPFFCEVRGAFRAEVMSDTFLVQH